MRFSKAFTILELVFVIVILGILAVIAIPKLAATREDAQITSLKTVLKQAAVSVPAHYTAQKVASYRGAMLMRTTDDPAKRNVFVLANNECTATYTDNIGDSVVMNIEQDNGGAVTAGCTAGATNATDDNLSLLITYNFTPGGQNVVAEVARLNNIQNSGDSERYALGGKAVSRD